MRLPSSDPWNDPATPVAYEAFAVDGRRYARANAELVRQAALATGMRVLDVGAGLGGTAAACLDTLGPGGHIWCVEPSDAMRARGRARLGDRRVRWAAGMPPDAMKFDRVVCGAAIWQLEPLESNLRRLAARLVNGGALVFTIPSAYLGEPDAEGSEGDPRFTALIGRLASAGDRGAERSANALQREASSWPCRSTRELEAALRDAGLDPSGWRFRHRLTLGEFAAWLKLPPVNHGLLAAIPPAERGALVDDAVAEIAGETWRWEGWRGWTAWKHAGGLGPAGSRIVSGAGKVRGSCTGMKEGRGERSR